MNLRREAARQLLGRAADDRYILARLVDDKNAPVWPMGFHAQQAVEKSLKAVLAARGLTYPTTHNLAMLLAMVREAGVAMPPDSEAATRLTPYAVAFRYGDAGDGRASALDVSLTLQIVDAVLEWARCEVAAST